MVPALPGINGKLRHVTVSLHGFMGALGQAIQLASVKHVSTPRLKHNGASRFFSTPEYCSEQWNSAS
jgi:hypothetical protein